MEITGKLKKVLKIESGTAKNGNEWKKQSCIVETDNKYNNQVCITAFGEENINSLNKLKIGSGVSISCNVYSREYNGKYYNQIDGWKFATSNDVLENSSAEDFVTSDEMPF
tara:strand:+ start:2661 stop:2993 length:333 start_codon:yes stop_codon:yes gene_type:complete